jgi:hypothetical protein
MTTKKTCKGQKITCDCEGHDPMASAWTGEWPETANGQKSLEEGKSRWDEMIGMTSNLEESGFYVFRSPNGFPLALMQLWRKDSGEWEASFGQPLAMQTDWRRETRT